MDSQNGGSQVAIQTTANPKTLKGNCQSCLMPFKKDPKGTARDSNEHCSYCFYDGRLAYQGTDVREFKKAMVDAIIARGENPLKARFYAFMAGFAPRWKHK